MFFFQKTKVLVYRSTNGFCQKLRVHQTVRFQKRILSIIPLNRESPCPGKLQVFFL